MYDPTFAIEGSDNVIGAGRASSVWWTPFTSQEIVWAILLMALTAAMLYYGLRTLFRAVWKDDSIHSSRAAIGLTSLLIAVAYMVLGNYLFFIVVGISLLFFCLDSFKAKKAANRDLAPLSAAVYQGNDKTAKDSDSTDVHGERHS